MRSTHHPDEQGSSTEPRRRVGWGRRRDRLDEIHDSLLRIDTALIVRDPGSARSADAFEGLRRQVAAAAGDRRRHIVQLTEVAEAFRRGDDLETLRSRAEEWLLQANVAVTTDAEVAEAFDFVGETHGVPKVLAPAYIDGATNSVVRRGIVERLPEGRNESEPAEEPSATEAGDENEELT